jgi:hypothetical protein
MSSQETSWDEIAQKKRTIYLAKRQISNLPKYFSVDYWNSGGLYDTTVSKIQTLNVAKVEYFLDREGYIPKDTKCGWYTEYNDRYTPTIQNNIPTKRVSVLIESKPVVQGLSYSSLMKGGRTTGTTTGTIMEDWKDLKVTPTREWGEPEEPEEPEE